MKKYSDKCLRCPYYLGIIKHIVSPCISCMGKNPPGEDYVIKTDPPQDILFSKNGLFRKKGKNK